MNLKDMLAKRPVDREAADSHKERMLEEVRAYRMNEHSDIASERGKPPSENL